MTDLFKSKESEFYIELRQERYYFPGEDILGDIILDLTKATKTNSIKVQLEGFVELGGRAMALFSKHVLIAQSPDGEKSYYLEPHTHRFPFVITIPTSEECKVPSTLEITKLVKVYYKLTAIYNKPFSVLDLLSTSTSTSINILEDVNVTAARFNGDFRKEQCLILSGETRPVKVSAIVGKRAAVKGDTIPVSITIEHIGVMVRDKAISVQLLRSVYYGKNQAELFGPKTLREVISNIEILGPINFTKTFDLKLALPSNLCPTVEKSAPTFKIEYSLLISVNLNEENPLRRQKAQDIAIFTFPFTIGTYPKLSFNIDEDDDDDDEEEVVNGNQVDDTVSSNSSEYDQVTETMKNLDLSQEAVPPQMIQQTITSPKSTPPKDKSALTPLAALPTTSSTPTYAAPPMMLQPDHKPIVKKKDEGHKPVTPSEEIVAQLPMMINVQQPAPPMMMKPQPTPPTVKKEAQQPAPPMLMTPVPQPVPPMLKNISPPINSSTRPTVTPLERLPSNNTSNTSSPVVKALEKLPSNGPATVISPFITPKMELVTKPINSPKSPVSHYQSAIINKGTTTHQDNSKYNINPADMYSTYKPGLSPTTGMHRHDSVISLQPSTSTSTIDTMTTGTTHSTAGRQQQPEPVHLIVQNQQDVLSPTVNKVQPPTLPPRPYSTIQNNGFALSQNNDPNKHVMSFPNNYQEQQRQKMYNSNSNHHHYQSPPVGHHPLPQYPQHNYNNNGFIGGMMPVPQPAPPAQQYNNDTYNNNNNNAGYDNHYNHHPQPSFPVPHPHNYGGSMGMMGMPSHQNYQPPAPAPQYKYYNN